MTLDPRARARAMATTVAVQSMFSPEEQLGPVIERLVEAALLAYAREVLTQEPDEEMRDAARAIPWPHSVTYRHIWKAMATVRAKSLEDS